MSSTAVERHGPPGGADSEARSARTLRLRLLVCFLAAVAIHAIVLWAVRTSALYLARLPEPAEPPGGVEVELVAPPNPGTPAAAAIPEPAPPAPPEPPPATRAEEPPPVPIPEPEPEPAKPPMQQESVHAQPPPVAPKEERHERTQPPRSSHTRANEPGAAEPRTGSIGTGGGAGGASGAGSTKPAYLSNPHPPYPPESKANREQGVVLIRVTVAPSGRVESASLEKSSGFPRLDSAALAGVRGWTFKPATREGHPVADAVTVPVRFRLE